MTNVAAHPAVPQAEGHDYESSVTIRHLQVGCWLVIFLMPLGVTLDYFVYREWVGFFFLLRLVCSALEFGVWLALRTRLAHRYPQWFGLVIAMLPTFFISWMIFAVHEPASPYYAGLNLILLAIAFVLRWDALLSSVAVLLTLAMYLVAAFARAEVHDFGGIYNNLYFIGLTGIIVVVGSRIHRQLRLRENRLRNELEASQKELKQSNEKLLEMDRMKSRFFANISHELRTPLTLLLAPLETLLHRYGQTLDAKSREMLLTMQSNGMRLLKLINDLLELVRLEAGTSQVRRECVDIGELLRGLVRSAQQMAEERQVALQVVLAPDLRPVMADRDKLEKILMNLQFNALKFTSAGGRVILCAAPQGEELVLTVGDTGVGIPEKNLPQVFSRFFQGETSSRHKYQGVGIGLALVKELTEVQGGRVAVQSQEGKGTTFTVCLPYLKPEPSLASSTPRSEGIVEPPSSTTSESPAKQEWLSNLYRRAEMFPVLSTASSQAPSIPEAHHGEHPKLLVADDEPDMLRFLKSQMQEFYQVIEAVDGQQAVERALAHTPDIILLDMMMPLKDGLQVCRELRAQAATAQIPIILITARADEETKLAVLSAGASDFLPKPFSTTELHVRIKNLVESYQHQRGLTRQKTELELALQQLKEAESQLVQTEKMASLGRMSAGIIHEINNPLNFATTGLYTLHQKGKLLAQDEQADYEEVLRDVEEGLTRVKTIVADLRSFSHNENERCDNLNATAVVASALRFVSHQLRDGVQVEERIPADFTIHANRNKLIQVLVNLFQNSLDAFHHKAFVDEQPTLSVEGVSQGDRRLLIVRDNGAGIAPEHLGKVFDPFFTTKDVGQGMGLGLSVCYRIMQEIGGNITVRSEPGKYCEFRLDFPVREGE